MEKKIGVVTIYDASGNIGNKLQNYAVIETYNRLGCISSTLATENEINLNTILRSTIFNWARIIVKHKKLFNPYSLRRVIRFKKFNKLLNVDYSLLNGGECDYDYYSVGSDQVWNPNFYKYDERRKDFYLLTFAGNKRKIAFSPSFSVESIPVEWEGWFANNLKTFSSLSVREEAGARIIKELTGKDATVLIDPTMLLSAEEWRKISSKPKSVKGKYILTYFLSPKCDAAKKQIKVLQRDMKVYEILNPDDKVVGDAGPAEFLWLIDHAEIILTDSFHACVFSFLFNKPFLVYDREWKGESMNSRLETLLSKFCIERKHVGTNLKNDVWEHNYNAGYQQLDEERKKAITYLENALSNNNK